MSPKKAICVFDPRCNSGIRGTIQFSQRTASGTVRIDFALEGFQPYAIHAVHIHEFGDLSEGCKSLGAHFNPTQTPHGHALHGHAGDLFNNLQADAQGRFVHTFHSPLLSLCAWEQSCIVGRSVVIHQFRDDLGSGGLIQASDGLWIAYAEMSTELLRQLSTDLGYPAGGSRKALLDKLQKESITTGNASTRIACAVIGLSQ